MSPNPSERKSIRLNSKYTLFVLLIAAFISTTAFLLLKTKAAPSDPDSTFNSSGKVSLNLPNNGNDKGYTAKVQPDGKVVIAGSDDNMRVVRYDTNGTLDSTFGVNGIATVDYGTDEELYDVEIQSDGKIVGFGTGGTGGDSFWTIFRLNTNGTLDTSFDGDGKFSYNVNSSNDEVMGGAIQPDGKIVACGYYFTGGQYDSMVMRLNTDGTFDTTFDTDGIRPFAFSGGTNDLAMEVVIQSDGKIVFCVQVSIGNDDFGVVRLNTDGSADTSFDSDGKNSTSIVSGNDDEPTNLALQSDGKIVVAGYTGAGSQYNYALARFNTNGSLDTAFDGDGVVDTDFGGGPDAGYGVAIQSDGKIVMSGYANLVGAGTRLDFGLVRFNTNGSLDTTFDGDGRVATQFNANNSVSRDVVIQPNGKIIAVGYNNWATVDIGTARYNTDGSLDTSWGAGKINLQISSGTTDEGRAVARQSDGKLVVVGRYLNGSNFAIVVSRYNTNGTIDNTFGGSGKVTTQINSTYPQAVAMQADGKIVVAGFNFTGSNYDFLLVRYNPNGTLDTTFDGDGMAILNITSSDLLQDVAIQPDGKIVAVGELLNGSDDYVILRYNTDGSLDTTFDTDGRANTSLSGGNDQAHCVAIQPDGKILAAGMATPSSNDFSIARYNTNGSLDTSFNGVGYNIVVNNGFNEVINDIALQPDGKIVVSGQANGGASADDFALARFNANGTLDTSFDVDGKLTTSFSNSNDRAFGVAIQPDGKILASGHAFNGHTLDFAFARYNSDGSPDNTFNGNGRRFLDFSGYDDEDNGISGGNLLLQPDGKAVVVSTARNGINNDIGIARIDAYTPDPQVQFSLSGYYVNEVSGTATITVTRYGDVSASASVDYATSDNTATAGLDYAATSGTLNFAANQLSNTFTVPIINDAAVESTELVNLALSNPSAGTSLGSPGTAVLNITDNDTAGTLDTSFGLGGRMTSDMGNSSDEAWGVAIQSDGKIVLGGSSVNGSGWDFTVVRYNADGSLDTSFDGDGKITTDFGSNEDFAHGVVIQSDGKIVLAGYSRNSSNYNFAVARYNTDGSLDTSFDGDGKTTTDFGSNEDLAWGVAIQSDGKIVLAGRMTSGSTADFAIARYNTDGSLDTSFDGDGKATTVFGSSHEEAYGVAIQSNGKIVLVGYSFIGSGNDFAVARYNTDGSLDTSFDGDGKVTSNFGSNSEAAWGVAIQNDGKIVLGGNTYNGSNYDFAVLRYNTDGSLDTSFDSDGNVTTQIGSSSDDAFGVAIQSDGKIVLAGRSIIGSNYDFALARYNTNGSLDTSFDGDGKATTDFYGSTDYGFDAAIQPDGQIVVAGLAVNSFTSSDFALARYNSNLNSSLVQFSSTTYSVNENGVTATITVTRTGSAGAVSVDYATSNGTAAAGSDYASSSGTLNWADGDSGSKTFTVSISDDTTFEGNETVNLALNNPQGGAVLGTPSTSVLTIVDNEGVPNISINDVSLTEGDGGTTNATFTVLLSNASTQTVTVDYGTSNGTATAGSDYTAASGSLTFSTGETSKTVNVSVTGDTIVEPNETFNVNLSNATNAGIADNQGICTITNDDAGGTIQFSNATYSVNEDGTNATITVTRTGGAASGVTVDYATSNGTATAGQDYTSASGTLTFDAGDTSKTFNVLISDDNVFESNETVNLSLSNATGGASLGSPSTAVLTIAETDVCSYSINPTSQNFGFAGGNNSVSVTVISGCSWTAVSNASWITVTGGASGNGNGTVNYSVAQNDGAARTGTITIAGQTFTVNQDEGCLNVSIPTGLTALKNSTLTVPVNVNSTTGREIFSFDFTLTYDPSVLTPLATPFDKSGTLSGNYEITFNSPSPGTLVISGFGTTPLTGSGTLLNLKFNVIGNPASCSSLTLTAFQFNEGSPCVNRTNGQACVINGTISGNVKYANGIPTQSNVPNVTLAAVGATTITGTTDTSGNYSITGFANGSYTVTPAKTGDVNGISAFDAALNAQHVAGIITLTANQRAAADVSNNGTLTSFDSSLIARYVALIPNNGITGTWKFIPSSRTYSDVITDMPNQNYDAILMGDISGDWTPPSSFAQSEKQSVPRDNIIGVSLPQLRIGQGTSFDVPISVQDTTGKGVIAYEFDLSYDPNILQLQSTPVETVGTLSDNMNVTVNAEKPGQIKVVVFGTLPTNGEGLLLKLKFAAIGKVDSISPLALQRFKFNENNPQSETTDGQILIVAPSAASAGVCGKVTNQTGKPVGGILVNLRSSQNGGDLTTTTNARGGYCFESVTLSADYVIQPVIMDKDSIFAPSYRSFTHTERREDIDFVALPSQEREKTDKASGGRAETNRLFRDELQLFFEKLTSQRKIAVWRDNVLRIE